MILNRWILIIVAFAVMAPFPASAELYKVLVGIIDIKYKGTKERFGYAVT